MIVVNITVIFILSLLMFDLYLIIHAKFRIYRPALAWVGYSSPIFFAILVGCKDKLGNESLCLFGLFVICGILTFLFLPPGRLRKYGWKLFLFYTLFTLILIYIYWSFIIGVDVNGGWVFGEKRSQKLFRESYSYLEDIANEIEEKLEFLGQDDMTSYDAGFLYTSLTWKKYGPKIKESINERDLNLILPQYHFIRMPREMWHSFFSRLYRIEIIKGTLYYNGGKLGKPNKISIRLFPSSGKHRNE